MSFNPTLFINVAKGLNNSARTEETSRSIVNRAYYGAFGHLKKSLDFPDYGTSSHQKLIDLFKYSVDKQSRIIAKKLEALFAKRKHADYVYHSEFKESCQYCIEEAENIIKMFDSLDQSET